MKLDNKTFQKWKKWVEKIKSDLQDIVDRQQIYNGFVEVFNANLEHIIANEGEFFCDFIRTCYGVQAAVGIRRHIKPDKQSVTLMGLLEQIRECATQFTYDFYLKCYPPEIDYVNWQECTYADFSEDGKVLSRKIIDNDIEELKQTGNNVEIYVDRIIAHSDKRGCDIKVTYGELEDAIHLFDKIACKYITLITSKGYSTLEPVIQNDWEKIFSVPLDIRHGP